MLFATLWKARTDITAEQLQQGLPRRMQWHPRGHIQAEYWFIGAQRGDWAGITIADVDDPSQIFEDLGAWADLLEMRTHLCVPVDQGLRMAQQAAAAAVTA